MEIRGIDVSAWQGKIDWKTVADYSMGFAILRITEAGNVIDSYFEQNFSECRKYNISVGAYKYSYAMTVAEIQSEARKVVEVLNGRKLQYPVWLDLEWNNQRSLGAEQIHKLAEAFEKIITAAGYKFGIYCNVDWYLNVICSHLKKYDFWIARYPASDNGTLQERLRPDFGVGWQYSSKAKIPGISGTVDRNIFYKDYTATVKNENKGEDTVKKTKSQIIQAVINDAVEFAVNIANDNAHGYSQRIRSLYEINDPKSFDCSSLACTAYYYAFMKNGLTQQARYLKEHCSYTGNMLNMCNCGFEVVARNQTAHAQMQKGDLELNVTHHVAMAIDRDNIVHARSSEGTTNTIDDSGNEIRTQPWYLYSHGWTHRLRFTGKGIDFSELTGTTTSKTETTTTSNATQTGGKYMFNPETVKAGDKNTSVLLLQEILRARGFKGKNGKALKLTWTADANTIYALKAYQESRKEVLEVDGICGSETWKDLIAI
jgi:GH25 family lysozyme M1 (1,4-beta-N-acetylmuramidase)